VLDVNLTGVAITDRLAARHMLALGTSGSIINIASIAGKRPLPGAADYCVSKAGVIMLTTVFATELATKNIRVNAIGPGFIETPMTASIRQSPEWVQTVMQMTPMQRFGQAHEIANTALFLASDESSYVSGQTLYPSGGMYTG
jgi:NAD(P)-dependent dehydrogenase (short-subunit alcohol dehydrogenase family)